MSNTLPTRTCANQNCLATFTPTIPKQRFCKRRCYAGSWYLKVKVSKRKLPQWRCPKCEVLTQLDFKPKSVKFAWSEYHCPNCGNPAM